LRTVPIVGSFDYGGLVDSRNVAQSQLASFDEEVVPSARALANQSASSSLASFVSRQQFQLALTRDRLMLSRQAINQSLTNHPTILGMNLDPVTGALLYPADVNHRRGVHASPTSSSHLGSSTMLATHDIAGAAGAIQIDQGRNGPNDDEVSILFSESFPVKLHRLLMDLHGNEGGTDVASFLPGGVAFAIHDVDRFETEVMPKYFPRMNKFASFQRQLNLYDFQRISDGLARRTYYHPIFSRDFPLLCREMKRTKIKGTTTSNRY
jgi:HSF-type DNA-binding